MVITRFPDPDTEKRALGFLAGRLSGKSYASGETVVPEAALAHLALEGIKFTVAGPATSKSASSPVSAKSISG
jgi:hypothetical protein